MTELVKKDCIEFHLNSWMENAAICGLVNILGEDKVTIKDQSIEVPITELQHFEEPYFAYFAKQYKKLSSLSKILAYKDEMMRHEEEEFSRFDQASYERLQKYLTDLKRYGESNSYLAVYPLLKSDIDILRLIKQAKIEKLKKGELEQNREQVIERVKRVYQVLIQIFSYYEQNDVQRYLGAKIQIYSVIKNGYSDVSFLNRQESKGDFFEKYHNYFVEPMFSHLEDEHKKDKLTCSNCGEPIKKGDISYSFINQAGYDANRKQSNTWSFTNDLFMCPACRLLYTCIPAGFTYVYSQGIFVNDNQSVGSLVKVNKGIRIGVLKKNHRLAKPIATYAAMIQTLQEKMNKQSENELQDIQVIRYENDKYYPNHLPKHILKTINKSKDILPKLFDAGFNMNGEYHNLYHEVISNLMNNTNLFYLIYQFLRVKVSGGQVHANSHHVMKMIEINKYFLEELIQVNILDRGELERIRRDGYFFKKEYANRNKADSIALRLLNALKANNKNAFMDMLLNSYMYLNKQVPKYFTDIFLDDEHFKTIGYSFVTGMVGEAYIPEGGKNNE